MANEAASARPTVATLVGAGIVGVSTIAYSSAVGSSGVPTQSSVAALTVVAEIYVLLLTLGVLTLLFGLAGFVIRSASEAHESGKVMISPGRILPYLLSLKRYRAVFISSVILYGIFFAFLTSMIVYQPGVDFASAYGAQIPSASLTPVFASPLFTPVLTVYLTDHLGLLLIPLTVLMALAVSILVAVNVAISVFAFDSQAKGVGRGWLGGFGAVVGLFTGCPTCAGLFFANVIGGTGAVSFAAILGYYQPIFILLSIPVLLLTPFLTSRSLSKVFKEGCIIVGRA